MIDIMEASVNATPSENMSTPRLTKIDTPLSTQSMSDAGAQEDTPLPSIETSDVPIPTTEERLLSSNPSKTSPHKDFLPNMLRNTSLSPPTQPPRFGCGEINGTFNYRRRFNATPEPTSEPQSQQSAPLQGSDSEVLRSPAPPSLEGLGDSFGKLKVKDTPSPTRPFYSAKDETAPSEPYFNPSFQKALKEGLALARKVAVGLDRLELAHKMDSDLYRLYKTARELENFESPATRTIGIVGDSGTGKSSLINSLLDQPNLAHKGDLGQAVTSFVTEYRHRSKSHNSAFTIEIEYLNKTEINEQLHELLWSYRQPFTVKGEDIDQDDYAKMESESKVALDTLEGIFGNRAETNAKYLQDPADDAFDSILKQLTSIASSLKWPEGAHDGKWTSTAENAGECQEKTGTFMKGDLWPFIKIVRIYLSAQALKTGLILADLPGYRDINFARVKAAQRYLFSCDEVFVVAEIKRVVTSKSVASIISECIGTGLDSRKRNFAIICTYADDIDTRNAEKTYCGDGKRLTHDQVNSVKKEKALAEQWSVNEHRKAEAKYKYLLIEARNADIKQQLAEKYTDLFPAGGLNVFCVSNKDYQCYLELGAEAYAPAIEGSGVPRLRQFCHSIPARAQYRATNQFLEIQLMSLVQSLELWLKSGVRRKGPKLPSKDFCVKLRDDIERIIDELCNELDTHLEEQILQHLKVHRRHFVKAALEKSVEWAGWSANTYIAFWPHNGNHKTQAIDRRCWNAELLAEVNQMTSRRWEVLEASYEKLISASTGNIMGQLQKRTRKIKKLEGSALLVKSMKTKERSIKYLIDERFEDMMREFCSIQRDATDSHHNSYVLAEMLSTYRKSATIHGLGKSAKLREIMSEKIETEEVFVSIRCRLRRAMNELFKKTASTLKQQLDEIYEEIENFLTLLGDSEATSLEGSPELLRLVEKLVQEAGTSLTNILRETEPAKAEAHKLGYI